MALPFDVDHGPPPKPGRSRIKGLRAAQTMAIRLHTRFLKYALHRHATAVELAVCARSIERLAVILEDLKTLNLRADPRETRTVRKRPRTPSTLGT
jgi:hypothetical protein